MADPIRLRQICLLTEALEPTIDELSAVFGLSVCYGKADLSRYGVPYVPPPPHQAAFFASHGLASAQLPIGDTFLELVAPLRAGTPAARYLERRGPGGYMVIHEVASTEPFVERIRANAVRLAGTVDYPEYHEFQVDPRDIGASILSFSRNRNARPFSGAWFPAGGDWADRAAPGNRAIVAAEIAVAAPAAVAARWAALIGREVRGAGDSAVIDLDDSHLRFVPASEGRPDRLDTIYIDSDRFPAARQAAAAAGALRDGAIEISGLRFRDAGDLTP